jgi:ACR3 family arsenite efflux pump ArsB
MEKKQGIEWFDRYLTIQAALCIIVGIAVGATIAGYSANVKQV